MPGGVGCCQGVQGPQHIVQGDGHSALGAHVQHAAQSRHRPCLDGRRPAPEAASRCRFPDEDPSRLSFRSVHRTGVALDRAGVPISRGSRAGQRLSQGSHGAHGYKRATDLFLGLLRASIAMASTAGAMR